MASFSSCPPAEQPLFCPGVAALGLSIPKYLPAHKCSPRDWETHREREPWGRSRPLSHWLRRMEHAETTGYRDLGF